MNEGESQSDGLLGTPGRRKKQWPTKPIPAGLLAGVLVLVIVGLFDVCFFTWFFIDTIRINGLEHLATTIHQCQILDSKTMSDRCGKTTCYFTQASVSVNGGSPITAMRFRTKEYSMGRFTSESDVKAYTALFPIGVSKKCYQFTDDSASVKLDPQTPSWGIQMIGLVCYVILVICGFVLLLGGSFFLVKVWRYPGIQYGSKVLGGCYRQGEKPQ